MIKVGAAGRLANHMFQYAFALAFAEKLHTNFEFDTTSLEKYFAVKSQNKFLSKIKKRLIPGEQFKEIHVNNLSKPQAVISTLQNDVLYSGYFQSADFFSASADLVRKAFTIKPAILKNFKEKYADQVKTDYTCVAIRLGDYKSWVVGDGLDVSPLLPYSFFEDGIQQIAAKGDLVFISDEIELVKNVFQKKFPHATFNEKCSDPIEDFLLLMHAKNSVISNSSFYWWACWLNPKHDKKVIVPKYWLGFRKNTEYPTGIIPNEWIQLPVTDN